MQKEELKDIDILRKPGSEVTFTGEIPYEVVLRHKAAALASLNRDIEIDGFRKGHIPEHILVSKVGEMTLLTEMAERALGRIYPELVSLHNLDVIGYPKIQITKLAKENPLGFTITVATVPDVSLPDYEKIARGINASKESKEVTDEDVTKQIDDVLRQKVAYERLQKKAAHDHSHEDHDHSHEEDAAEEPVMLPELTDDYVKTLGKPGQFTGVDDLRNKVRDHLIIEKERDVDSRHRAKLTDAIIERSSMDLPRVLVDAEINQMFAQMEDDLKRAQLSMDDYLSHVKKTREDLKKEWAPSAEKRAKLQLVLNAIAKAENISPDLSLVDHEVSHLMEHYKDADERRVRTYITSVLTNEAVMKRLESIS